MAAESKDDTTIFLISNDGTEFEVPLKVAQMSDLVGTTVDPEDLDDDADDDSRKVPLMSVSGAVLGKIIEYCTHHVDSPPKDIPTPLKPDTTTLDGVVSDFDKAFVDVDAAQLFDIILAANYMQINSLVTLGCAALATALKGKDEAELRKNFHIENDFTPEEEQFIRETNKWATEDPEPAPEKA